MAENHFKLLKLPLFRTAQKRKNWLQRTNMTGHSTPQTRTSPRGLTPLSRAQEKIFWMGFCCENADAVNRQIFSASASIAVEKSSRKSRLTAWYIVAKKLKAARSGATVQAVSEQNNSVSIACRGGLDPDPDILTGRSCRLGRKSLPT